jgi:Uma2 family endonuclease
MAGMPFNITYSLFQYKSRFYQERLFNYIWVNRTYMIANRTMISLTEEEYIQYELTSNIRHEYVNGELIDMPGESTTNNTIALNLAFLVKQQLKGTGYKPYTHDVKLRILEEKTWFYPDLFVSAEQEGTDVFVMQKPVLITEVLSKSTGAYDVFDKFIQYRKIPELQYYMLIEPVKKIVTLLSRTGNNEWQTEFFNGLEEEVNLPKLNVHFRLSDLYE